MGNQVMLLLITATFSCRFVVTSSCKGTITQLQSFILYCFYTKCIPFMSACLHCNNQSELSSDVKRMAFNSHKLAHYCRQRKRDLLTQLALIIAFYVSLSPMIRTFETVLHHTVPAHRLYESCLGSVWFGLVHV